MKIVSKFFIFTLVFLGFGRYVFSQENILYVTPGDGLNLRSSPAIQSQIIRVLPFLTKVEILDKNDDLFIIDGIISQWYKVRSDNTIGWVFGGYLSKDLNIPKVDNKTFIAVYRIKNINIGVDSFGFENIVKRLRKSYLVIYETTGNKRYIYDDEGLIERVPRFGDGTRGSDAIVSGIPSSYRPSDENRELTETILITFQSYRNYPDRPKYDYEITVIYEKIEIEAHCGTGG